MFSILGLAVATPGLAQTPTPAPADAETVGEIVVTGSRIRVQDYVAPNPVQTISAESISQSGQTNLTQFLQDVPALVNSVDSETGADVNSNFNGLALLNLRNLGTGRTLVLVDGRRHVGSSPGTSSVDVSQIPIAMVERTEILTGGASAIYGADGVTGVVNFILRKDFEGVDMRSQYGWSDKGGGENTFVSLLAGHDFDSGRGNIMIGAEYDSTKDLDFNDREFTRVGNTLTSYNNPDDGTGVNDDPNVPDFLIGKGLRWFDTSLEGSVFTNFNTAPSTVGASFLGNGTPYIDGEYVGNAYAIGGSGTPLEAFNDDLIPGQDRYTLYASGRYDLNDNHQLFADVKYTSSKTDFIGQPSYDYGLFVSIDNPFIPANILADALTPGGLGTPDGAADNGLPGPGVLIARDNFFLGRLEQDTENETLRAVFGLRGSLGAGIDYEVSYVAGEANQTIEYSNVRLNDRYYAATDVVVDPVTGANVCRSNLDPSALAPGDIYGQFVFDDPALAGRGTFTPGPASGCVPLNPFGTPSAEALDWVMGEGVEKARLTQQVLNAFVTGDTEAWFSLPSGPISFVLGGEYRKERSTTSPDRLQTQAEALDFGGLTGLGRSVATRGQYEVSEVFTELSVPVLRDLPFAKELTLNGAYRYSDYSTVGGTDTWNLGLRYRPIQDIMFRATQARAVRAPNINDIFRGRSQTAAGFADPCSSDNIAFGDNPANRLANCTAAFTALGLDVADYTDTSSETTVGFITGNPLLQPEEADTFTVGFVANPRFLPGLALTLDYYDIEITGAIASYSVQTIVNNCYDLPAGNPFCDLITRGTPVNNPGRIVSFDQVPGNLSSFTTSGVDFGVRYALNPADLGVKRDIGLFTFTLNGNYLDKLETQPTADADVNDDKGEEGAPEWQANFDLTWVFRDLTVNYGYSWFDKTSRVSNVILATQPDYYAPEYMYYDERSVHDIQVQYQIDDRFEVYGGVNNFTDQEPEPFGFGDASYPVSSLGRFFYIGVNANF
ncbi:TonB-dependent siderophore receptor [uncultured Brevundimonas sp.]|uniref:TonB-dependent receptor plug domain-containing protein n=1 Tax=uncultured Brevundimonas sp. TaxID=213418 RepID=UPI00260189D1|nr:TonB-dependent receptor [uncultured Brevundimonas sp.]